MKKFLAILLAMMLVMVSVAAMADDPNIMDASGQTNAQVDANATAPVTLTIYKTYTVTGPSSRVPAHTVSFTVAQDKIEDTAFPNDWPEVLPTATGDVAEDTTSGDNKANVTITLPSYTHPGVYWYTLVEDDGHIAGVAPNSDTYYLKVTVWNDGGKMRLGGIALRNTSKDKTETTDEDGNVTTVYDPKTDTIDDTYTAGELLVTKTVSGKLGDYEKDFTFTVTFTPNKLSETTDDDGNTVKTYETVKSTITVVDAGDEPGAKFEGNSITAAKEATDTEPAVAATVLSTSDWNAPKTVTITLKHNQAVLFKNIPKNVSYEVTETDYTSEGYTTSKDNESATINTTRETAAFTNTKDITIDTGITLETLPYVLMMALAMMGLVALKLRKREEY